MTISWSCYYYVVIKPLFLHHPAHNVIVIPTKLPGCSVVSVF